MAAARSAAKGLSTVELEQIRDTLKAGRKPKVQFTEAAGQIAGQIGQVVELTDPEVSDEFVVVRFGRDELPFAPTDLVVAPKAAPQKRVTTPPPPLAPPADASASAPTVPSPREETPVPAAAAPTTVNGKAPAKAAAAPPAPAPEPPAEPAPSPAAAAADKPAPEKKAPVKKAAKAKAPAGLTVTLQYADGEWTVGATQGTKALAKPYLIKPAEALKMVSMLDVPAVHEAVEDILSTARAEAEQQAERLRAELAEIEARLAELNDGS